MQKKGHGNIINLARAIEDKKTRHLPKGVKSGKPNTRVIAITSGKGGVGKTNIVANLGFALSRLGKKILILDADLGLGNLDVLLGLAPTYNLSHVITGEKSIPDVIVDGPGTMKILPAASGIQELTHLTKEQQFRIITELDFVIDPIDILLVDTAAGISSNVMYFNVTAQENIVVVAPEPTSVTDAYALMKVLALKYSAKSFNVLVNLAGSMQEGYEVFRQLSIVAEKFLHVSVEYFGCVLSDENVTKSVKQQKTVSEVFPDSRASRCYASLAKRICNSQAPPLISNPNSVWKHFVPEYL